MWTSSPKFERHLKYRGDVTPESVNEMEVPRGVRNLLHAFSVEGRLRLKIKAKHWRLNLWKLELLWIACGKLFRIFQSTLADCNLPQLCSVDLISCE